MRSGESGWSKRECNKSRTPRVTSLTAEVSTATACHSLRKQYWAALLLTDRALSFSSQGKQSQEASFIACGQLSIICFLNYEKWDGNKITGICFEQLCSPKQVWELFRVCGVHREWSFHFNLFKYKVCISENTNFVALLRNRQFAQVLWFLRYNFKECIYKGNKTLFGWDKGECLGRNFVSISLWFRSVWVVFHLSCIDGKHNPVIGISHLILQQIN